MRYRSFIMRPEMAHLRRVVLHFAAGHYVTTGSRRAAATRLTWQLPGRVVEAEELRRGSLDLGGRRIHHHVEVVRGPLLVTAGRGG
jgi:hypothetical protein